MGANLSARTGALSAGILLACAVAACSDSTPTTPSGAACTATLELSRSTVELRAWDQISRLTVTAPAGCTWTLSRPSWVGIASRDSGDFSGGGGTGTVTIGLSASPSTFARSGEIGVLNATVTLYQEDACSFRTDQQFFDLDGAGGHRSVALTASPGCAWSLQMPPWIHVTPASGTGSATLAIDVEPTDSPRAGLISMVGRGVGVRQTPTGRGMSPLFAFSNLHCDSIRPYELKIMSCWFFVVPATNPTSSSIRMVADMRAVGGTDNDPLVLETYTQGLGFIVDFRLESLSVSPGLKSIPLTARDAEGRTATATATFVVPPPK